MVKNTPAAAPVKTKKSNIWLGILPFIGVILFVINVIPVIFGDHSGNWQQQIVLLGVIYMIGWAGIGAGISHIFFGKKISQSIGFEKSPFELEVGFAGLSFGIVALIAGHFSTEYWLAIILASSLYRIGCGIGHVRSMIISKNFAINNTAILFIDFVVPAFLLFAYFAWA